MSNSMIEIYNFNTSWCGHSKRLEPVWNQLKQNYNEDPTVKVIDVKCDEKENESICSSIKGYPTIVLKTYEGKFIEYNGDRSLQSLINFIEQNH